MEQSLQDLGNLADEFHCMVESKDNFTSFETSFQKKTQSEENNDDISFFEEKKTQRNLDFEEKNDFSGERKADFLRFRYITLSKELGDLQKNTEEPPRRMKTLSLKKKKTEEPPLPCKRRMKKCPPLRKPLTVDVVEVHDKSQEVELIVDEVQVDVEEEHVDEEQMEEEQEEQVDVEEKQEQQLPEEKKSKKNPYWEWLPNQRIPKRNIVAQPVFPDLKTCSSENLLNFIKASELNNVKAKTDLIINALQTGKSIEVIFI